MYKVLSIAPATVHVMAMAMLMASLGMTTFKVLRIYSIFQTLSVLSRCYSRADYFVQAISTEVVLHTQSNGRFTRQVK